MGTDGRNTEDFFIPAATTSEGTFPAGTQWRRNPIPMCNCDAGQGCKAGSADFSEDYRLLEPYRIDASTATKTCPTGLQFESPFPEATEWSFGYGPNGELAGPPFQMIDTIEVPQVPKGEYTLSWRWDCEQTPQVWNQCADILIQ